MSVVNLSDECATVLSETEIGERWVMSGQKVGCVDGFDGVYGVDGAMKTQSL